MLCAAHLEYLVNDFNQVPISYILRATAVIKMVFPVALLTNFDSRFEDPD